MKKTIAILAVLVIVLGCVFAATEETHNIKLKTNVGIVVPVYQLQFVEGTNTADNQTSHTNDAEADFAAGTKAATADIEVLDISKNDISVTFKAVLMNEAKINKAYTLTFSATSFAVKKDGKDAEVAVDSETVTAAGKKTGVTTAAGAADNIVVATFNGATCSATGTDLATYTVTYKKDTAVDPHTSDDQYYYATVTMTVSAS